jgi:PAS domain S-box-containing protein
MEVSLSNFLTALGSGGLATLLTIGTKFYLDLRKSKQDEQAIKSTSTAAEWAKTSEEWSKLVDRLSIQVGSMQDRMATLIKENNQWQVENEYLRGEIRLRDSTIVQLRGGMPISTPDGLIVADESGNIIQVNSTVTLLLHYTENELLGKPVAELIPQRYQAAHNAGWQRVRDTGQAPDGRRIIKGHALTKGGEEVPVELQLTSWQTGGHSYYGAAMRRRSESPQPASPERPAGAK